MKSWSAIHALPVAILFTIACFGQKSYDIHRVTSPITIDGKLDEGAWKAAPSVGDFTSPGSRKAVKSRQSRRSFGMMRTFTYPGTRRIVISPHR